MPLKDLTMNSTINDQVNVTVYVVSVRNFKSRQQSIKTQMGKIGLKFEFVFRYDSETLSADAPSIAFAPNAGLSMAEQSTVAKHVEAWRLGLKCHTKYLLVLEDDALLCGDFLCRLDDVIRAAADLKPGHLINIGCANARPPRGFIETDRLLTEAPLETAEAYLTDKLGLARRLVWLESNLVELPADHLLKKIDEQSETVHYWTRWPLVEQGSLTGKFKSSLDQRRASSSPLTIYLGYISRKLRRRVFPQWISKLKAGRRCL